MTHYSIKGIKYYPMPRIACSPFLEPKLSGVEGLVVFS